MRTESSDVKGPVPLIVLAATEHSYVVYGLSLTAVYSKDEEDTEKELTPLVRWFSTRTT